MYVVLKLRFVQTNTFLSSTEVKKRISTNQIQTSHSRIPEKNEDILWESERQWSNPKKNSISYTKRPIEKRPFDRRPLIKRPQTKRLWEEMPYSNEMLGFTKESTYSNTINRGRSRKKVSRKIYQSIQQPRRKDRMGDYWS